MFKFFVLLLIYISGFCTYSAALDNAASKEENLANSVQVVIEKILKDEKKYQKLSSLITKSNEKINVNKSKIEDIHKKKNALQKELKTLKVVQETVESNIIKLTVKRYSKSRAVKYASKKSTVSIVDNEVYVVLVNSIKSEVKKYNEITNKLDSKILFNIKLEYNLNSIIQDQEKLISYNQKLKNTQEINIRVLKTKHKLYVQKLEEINKEQEKMKEMLAKLKIVNNTTTKPSGAVSKITPTSKELEKKISEISSESSAVKMSRYTGRKTIAPFKNYIISEKFGKYYDPIYHAELFNKSISLTTKKQTTNIRNMLAGEIFFIKRNAGRFKNIIIVKHSNGLNIIYSNLDQISSRVTKGKKISKGYILGKINDKLVLQATKNNKYIDPEKIFK